jgi:hypothetical protein
MQSLRRWASSLASDDAARADARRLAAGLVALFDEGERPRRQGRDGPAVVLLDGLWHRGPGPPAAG